MTREDSARLARLLSGRDEPSVLETEALFDRIASDVAPRPWWRRPVAWGALSGIATAAAAAFLFVALPDSGEFGSRGGEEAVLRPHCVTGAETGPCTTGAKLLFDARPPEGAPHFAALAKRPDGTFIWYLPAPDARSAALGAETAVVATAIRLGDEHPAGAYTVFGVFTKDAMTRDEIEAAVGDDLAGGPGVTVVRRELEVR
ncbi:MAG: hypothetical protein RMA76_24195 [Deltaproteobacteria bacterium]|jgi:hypothetical protein